MPKKQRPNSKKAKKARRKEQKKKDAADRLCTDLVAVATVKEAEPSDEQLDKNEELFYGSKGLRRIRKAREQMTPTALSTANPGNGTVTKEQAEAFRRKMSAKYGKRWDTILDACEESEVGYASVFRDISRIHQREWKKLTGLEELMLDTFAVYDDIYLVFYFRGLFRKRAGHFTGAIDDLSLSLHSARRYHDADAFLERGRCLRSKGDLDSALVDFRACRAICLPSKVKECEETSSICVKEILETLVLQAIQRKGRNARPLFTKKEQYKIERDLGINSYNMEKYRCEYCGSTELSVLVEQGFDTRCGAWYCSARCQKQAWEAGHKEVCHRRKPYFSQDTLRATIEEKFAESDVVAGFLRDGISRRIFDGLTNREVFFLPSELDLVPQKFKKAAESYLENLPNQS